MSQDWRAGEYCLSELSVDCLRISYKTWAAWALDTSWVSYNWISSGDPGVGWTILIILGPGGLFLGNPWVLDPEGPHSAILGDTTLGTCWGIVFYHSEAGHYRVPVLHAASGLKGAGVGENPSARFATFHVWKSRILCGAPGLLHLL
ncbi:hypothetical protein F2Q69_00036222 [Brassica cretica]|uniref:Uncharacterized protein n=1 Tax=Brassica cretica TaxID=69181 RepID=A0A8S9SEY5_BRACR|nr:hypothetical protein F2Q69_00036222 [Brassica cretica]